VINDSSDPFDLLGVEKGKDGQVSVQDGRSAQFPRAQILSNGNFLALNHSIAVWVLVFMAKIATFGSSSSRANLALALSRSLRANFNFCL
jgi:hypothetical protein